MPEDTPFSVFLKTWLVLFLQLSGTGVLDFDFRSAGVNDLAGGGDGGVKIGFCGYGNRAGAVVHHFGFLGGKANGIEVGRTGAGHVHLVGVASQQDIPGVGQGGGEFLADETVEIEFT